MGALHYTEKLNSEVVACAARLWAREVPLRALREHGVVNGAVWVRGPGTPRCPMALGAPGQRARLSGTRGNVRPETPGWLCGGGASSDALPAESEHPNSPAMGSPVPPNLPLVFSFISSLRLGCVYSTV